MPVFPLQFKCTNKESEIAMKNLKLTTAALLLVPGIALADSHSNSDDMSDAANDNGNMEQVAKGGDNSDAKLIRTRDITGGVVYSTGQAGTEEWKADDVFEGLNDQWTRIGEIEDIVLTESGDFHGIVAEVGGFLDLGDKHVMLEIDDVNLVALDDGTYAYVTNRTEEQLEEMEGVDEGFWD